MISMSDKEVIAQCYSRHLRMLCDEIGARPAGSVAHQAAAKYIMQWFEQCGLDVMQQAYSCPVWQDLGTSLILNGVALDAAANPFSPPCDVWAPFKLIGTIEELALAELKGFIAVLYGDLTKDVLACKSWFLITEREKRIIQLLEEKNPAAIIAIQNQPVYLNRLIEDWEFHIPSVTVPRESGLALLTHPSSNLKLSIHTHQESSQAANIIARKPGSQDTQIVICAHYDTKIDTPGALDNASGVAALLIIAQIVSERQFNHGMEFVAFGSEEYLPIGEDAYLPSAEAKFGKTLTAINMDGIAYVLGSDTVMLMASSAGYHTLVDKLKKSYPAIVWTDPWPQSNHSSFATRGVPSMAFTSPTAWILAHDRADSFSMVNPNKALDVIRLVVEVVQNLQDKDEYWTR